jgi:hypothetical protein
MGGRSFVAGAMMGGGHYGGVTMCDPNDDSFYCKLNRFTNEIHMLLFLIMIVLVPLYFIGKKTGLLNKFIKS